ncbi:hypothetical protein [Desulfobotulus mexicanus]|uniref:Uncharacterized protein n=1 Tax=Desulfobotulus mexicanus TaxID=2586642 RepID=A0A5Q4VI48_9BACT|nr:hypothetical protein [Desulfobotulus mexicanus]TYT75927.1 hypothetical protein FIM25_03260 [Desulfobotulus mexicanus]
MKQFENEAALYIWPYKGINHPGHAAIAIRALDKNDIKEPLISAYISWWPEGGDDDKVGLFNIRPAKPHSDYFSDKYAEMGPDTSEALRAGTKQIDPKRFQKKSENKHGIPYFVVTANKKYNLPGFGTKRISSQKSDEVEDKFDNIAFRPKLAIGEYSLWGLALNKMAFWWYKFCTEEKHGYRFVSTKLNCSGVVMQCLLEGCADAYIDIKSPKMYITPNDVDKACMELVKKIDCLNIESYRFIVNLRKEAAVKQTDLYTYDQFYKASNAGKWARRREQVAKIDEYLTEYHLKGAWSKDNFKDKFKCMARMMDNVISHRSKKPKSVNGLAVESLGAQILSVLSSKTFHDTLGALSEEISPDLVKLLRKILVAHEPLNGFFKKEKKI